MSDLEIWKAHPNISGVLVSSLGHVLRGKKEAKIFLNDKGYQSVNVGNRICSVHVLVLETFVGPRPLGHDADHINKNRRDNSVANLRWIKRSENRAHKGRANQAAKLTVDDVLSIRKERQDNGTFYSVLAKKHCVDPKTVREICRRELWKHV